MATRRRAPSWRRTIPLHERRILINHPEWTTPNSQGLLFVILQGGKVAEGTVMAADQALSLARVQEAARSFFALVSNPASLPEFEHLQVRC